MEDLSTIIEDSLTDATLPTPEVDLDSTPEPVETASDPTPEPVEAKASIEVPNPAVRAEEAAKPTEDDFDKKYGLASVSASGRENRIPYSRVKKITEKAVNDAKATWQKETASGYVPTAKFTELDTKVKDYEGRLQQVAEFEKVMTQDPVRFLQMLNGLPAYAQIFEKLQQPRTPESQAQAAPQAPVPDDMPQPDVNLPDGTSFYSMDGVKALNAWNRAQAKKETMTEVESRIKAIEQRYAPLEKDYNSYQTVQKIMPQVERQIADARTWPLFNESETEIVSALQQFPQYSLERAYQHVVLPKLQAQQAEIASASKVTRESLRAEILNELKQAPRATSASTGSTRPTQTSAGPRSIEDVIADSIKGIK